jgi:phospholipid/cholesterol/gamma-HCH transport system permease protein
MTVEPSFATEPVSNGLTLRLNGRWTIGAPGLERNADALLAAARARRAVVLDLSGLEAMDTAGAWLIDRTREAVTKAGGQCALEGGRPEYEILLGAAHYRDFEKPREPHGSPLVTVLTHVGKAVVSVVDDLFAGIAFLGQIITALLRILFKPARLRTTSVVFHLDAFALRALPIIALINFLVGCIVAQQGIFQLQRFGAATFAVDLIGILVLRELAVLLTSIMVAGRSGSAITAEIGAMKMREEIDALRVMGLDPVEVLVVPRFLALLIALPLLTFVADMAAISGGLLVGWVYGGISPEIFLSRLQNAIALNTFLVGLIKAPFMAAAIALISAVEGFAVQGSAESLGKRVTGSVVKSIFMVIVVDGLFAMFFAAIKY